MKEKKTEFVQIDRKYIITSKELKDKLGVEGEIVDMCLWSGRSPNDIDAGVSADKDKWQISSREIKKKNPKGGRG